MLERNWNPTSLPLVMCKFAFKSSGHLSKVPQSSAWKHSRTAYPHIEMALVEFAGALPESMRNSVPIIVTVFVLYLSWRIWRFSISPALNPSRPRPLPYLVPCK